MFNFKTKKALRVEVENLNSDVDVLTSNNVKLRKQNTEIKNENKGLISKIEDYKKIVLEMNEKLEAKELQRRKLACKIGGLNTGANKTQKELGEAKTKIQEMKQEIKELKNKLAESMTDKYLVKKIPSGRTPKPEKMRIKSNAKQSKIIKDIKES